MSSLFMPQRLFRSMIVAVMTVSTVGAIALLAQSPVRAQTANEADPLGGFQSNEGSELFGSDGSDASSVFNLIHNLVLTNGTTLEDFNRQRSQNITTEAESFREAQMRQIQNQQSAPLSPEEGTVVD